MKILVCILISILAGSCTNIGDKKYQVVKKGDLVIKGKVDRENSEDSLLYFDLSDRLVRKEYYRNDLLNGSSIDYYPSGKPRIVTSYLNGLKNGYNSYYDLNGNCYYRDYYYQDLPMGPLVYIDNKGLPRKYYFLNLQNETLLYIDYSQWKGIREIYSDCIYFTANLQGRDSDKEVSVLLYLPNPPKLRFSFSIVKKVNNSNDMDFVPVKVIKDSIPFARITLPVLPSNERYTVKLSAFDSLFNKESVVYKDISFIDGSVSN